MPDFEDEIRAKGLNAPRLTPASIEDVISGEYFTTLDKAFEGAPISASMATFTICALALRNGFIVLGESAPVSAENFDAELGRKIARQKALDKIWALEGYVLRNGLIEAAALSQGVQA